MVGGQLAIIGHRVRPYLTNVKTDATGQETTMYLSFHFRLSRLLVINTYWEPTGGSENSLLMRVQNSPPATSAGLSGLHYLQTEICDKVMAFMVTSPEISNIVLMSDLNSTRYRQERGGSSHPPLQKWMDETGFTDPIGNHLAEKNTRLNTCGANGEQISRIDHCLCMLTSAAVTAYGVSQSPIWVDITNHVPLLIKLKMPLTRKH